MNKQGAACLAAAIYAGVLVFSFSANAALVLEDEFDTTAAFGDSYAKFSSGHAFWLPTLNSNLGNVTTNKWVFKGDGVTQKYHDTIALTEVLHMIGTLRPDNDVSGDYELDVDVWLIKDGDQSYAGKRELKDEAYVDHVPPGPVDPHGPGTQKWVYYNMVEGVGGGGVCETLNAGTTPSVDCTGNGMGHSVLTGLGLLSGYELDLMQKPSDGSAPFQMGDGANGKNILFGASMWFDYDIIGSGSLSLTSGHGDINVDVDYPIPEPATITLFGLGLLGLGALRRRSLRTA